MRRSTSNLTQVMKIVHLATHAQCNGNGAVNAMVDLACMQARIGHDVMVASSGGSFELLLRRHGVTHVLLQQSRQPWRVPAMIAGFSRLIERFDPDLVHAHMMTGALISRFGSMRRRFALVTTVQQEIQKGASLMRFGDRVIAVSHAAGAAMLERGLSADRLSVVANGTIGSPRHGGRPVARPVPLQHPSVVSVSGLFERSGIADLLHAFALVRQSLHAHLYLVGDGPERGALEALAQQLGLAASLHFAGFLADPRAYLAEADVFVMPAHQAAAPLVLNEARAAGCAIRRDEGGRRARDIGRRCRWRACTAARTGATGGENRLAADGCAGAREICGKRSARSRALRCATRLLGIHDRVRTHDCRALATARPSGSTKGACRVKETQARYL